MFEIWVNIVPVSLVPAERHQSNEDTPHIFASQGPLASVLSNLSERGGDEDTNSRTQSVLSERDLIACVAEPAVDRHGIDVVPGLHQNPPHDYSSQ